jgi:hypothetical protein
MPVKNNLKEQRNGIIKKNINNDNKKTGDIYRKW